MSETYQLKLGTETPYVGTTNEDHVPLSDYDYTDEEWDALDTREQNRLLNEWSEENFWNQGFGHYAEVIK